MFAHLTFQRIVDVPFETCVTKLDSKLGAKRRNRTAERNPETATPVDLAH